MGSSDGQQLHVRGGRARVAEVFRDYDVAFHNAVFDIDVAETHMKLTPKRAVHCTMVGAFIKDPRVVTLKLKELSELWLGEPPTERDALRDWIINNVPEAKRSKKSWVAYISHAPGDLVAPYACGDVDRTFKLHRFVQAVVGKDAGLTRAYRQ